MSFAGKSVLVTGSSSGIGAATVILFAEQGANVVVLGRDQTKLNAVAEKLPKNAQSLILKADVSTDAKKIIDETMKKFGKIDILVNNAALLNAFGSLTDGNYLEVYDAMMRTNVRAVAELTMLALPHLKKTKGNIVNISSGVGSHVPLEKSLGPYSVSKAALDHLTRGSALEFAPLGIRVNSVSPGPVLTEGVMNLGFDLTDEALKLMTPLQRVSQPEEIGELILYLASDKAKGITGSILVSDNGFLLRPTKVG